MRRRRPNRGALWLCLALQIVLGVPAALGLSLCVDSDGCHSVEIAHEQVECLRLAHVSGDGAIGAPMEELPCRDLPLLERRDYDARVAKGALSPALIATLTRVAAVPPVAVVVALCRSDVWAPPSDRTLLRSVILII